MKTLFLIILAQVILQPVQCGWAQDEACMANCKASCTSPAQYVQCKSLNGACPPCPEDPTGALAACRIQVAALQKSEFEARAERDTCARSLAEWMAAKVACDGVVSWWQTKYAKFAACIKPKCPSSYKKCGGTP